MVRFSLAAAIVLYLVVISCKGDEDKLLDIRMRFNPSSETSINDQINREYKAMYMYEGMMSYFGRPNIGLPGFKKFFKKASDEKREHAHKLIDYMNKRGGSVHLKTIFPAAFYKCNTTLSALMKALEAKKNITAALYRLRDDADHDRDFHLVYFIESEFLTEQVNGIRDMRELIAKLERVKEGLGEHIIDKELLEG